MKLLQKSYGHLNILRKYGSASEHQQNLMKRGLPVKKNIENVKSIIAVASGKGGVGKSTTAVNLALSIANLELHPNVGLLDMDVFGPSIPLMMNLNELPQIDSDKRIVPLRNYGIQCMSMGFLVDKNASMVWRGPMVMSAVQDLLFKTKWTDVDYLIIDLPPGTGDTQLSLSQLVNVNGAVIVSTPQDIALLDARRGVEMFKKVNIPVLGVIQNMSVFICPNCSHQTHIFGCEGAQNMASEIGVKCLGDIPLDISIRKGADSGKPIVVEYPESHQSLAYKKIASLIDEAL